MPIGTVPMMMYHPMRASRWPRSAGCQSERQPRHRDAPDVSSEVPDHRQLGADLRHRGEGGARVVLPEELRVDREVGAARDRQELGQTLQDAQQDGFEPAHVRSLSSTARPPHGVGLYRPILATLTPHGATTPRVSGTHRLAARSRHDDLGPRHR